MQSVQGMLYNPVSGAWSWTNSTAINYALHAVKHRDDPQPDRAEERSPRPEDHTAATHSWATRLENKSDNVEKWINSDVWSWNFTEARGCDAAYVTVVIKEKEQTALR